MMRRKFNRKYAKVIKADEANWQDTPCGRVYVITADTAHMFNDCFGMNSKDERRLVDV